MLGIIFIAAYLVAFLLNKKALTLLFVCVCCEFAGFSPLFLWAVEYYHGAIIFLIWGIAYALYVLIEEPKGRLFNACVIMALFQFYMSIDSKDSNGAETNLYLLYEYIAVLIHCYILSSFITRRGIIRSMEIFTGIFRSVINANVLNLVFWYTVRISQETNKPKSCRIAN